MSEPSAKPAETNIAPQEDTISLPLYLAGLVVSVLGLLAVNSSLTDSQIGTTTIVLTVLGFIFSLGCRWLQIKGRVVEVFVGCIAVYFVYRYLTHTIDLDFFVPPDVKEGDLVMAIVLMWLTVVRSWVLVNDDSVVFTAVTSVAMIGLVGASNLNGDLIVYFFAYIIAATFLLLHQTYLTQRSWALPRKGAASESSVISLQVFLAFISGIVAIILAGILVVPLRAVGAHLSLASALKNLVGAQHLPGSGNDSGPEVSLSDDPDFHVGTGSGYSANDQTVLRVFPSDGKERYYRGRTYDTYEGNGWSSSAQSDGVSLQENVDDSVLPPVSTYNMLSPGTPGADPTNVTSAGGAPLARVTTRMMLVSAYTNMLYVPYGTHAVNMRQTAGVTLTQFPDNSFQLNVNAPDGFNYLTFSDDPIVDSPEVLEHVSEKAQNYSRLFRNEYIDQKGSDVVPVSDQERLAMTAQQIIDQLPKKRRSEFDKAEAIRTWVSTRCIYDLNVNPVPSGDDAVSYFLFDSRKGYCDLFASSMAILCRYAGIPARVATGFGTGVPDDHGGYDLKVRDKHAWVEVWFSGYGWQIFDPTEGSSQASETAPNGFDDKWLLAILARVRLFLEINGELPIVIGIACVLGLLYLFKVEVLDKRLKPKSRDPFLNKFRNLDAAKKSSRNAAFLYSRNSVRLRYQHFELILRAAGITRASNDTPLEFLKTLQNALSAASDDDIPDKAAVNQAAVQLTDDVMLASYAPIDLVGEALLESEESGSGVRALELIEKHRSSIKKYMKKVRREETLRVGNGSK